VRDLLSRELVAVVPMSVVSKLPHQFNGCLGVVGPTTSQILATLSP
jgi:hypothetical protein